MNADQQLKELRAAAGKAPAVAIHQAWRRKVVRAAVSTMPMPRIPGVTITTTRLGTMKVRVYSPSATGTARPALLWIHGGGLVIGHPRQDDRLCQATAHALGCVIVSPDYRLAPEHPYPAALEDCQAAWRMLIEDADALGVDVARLAIGGQSAGAGLAVATSLRLRDQGQAVPGSMWLWAPMLDDRTAAKRELDGLGHAVWTNVHNRFAWQSYLAAEPGDAGVSKYAAPARAIDLSGLPATWIGIGTEDLFHPEATAFGQRLHQAGVSVDTEEVTGGFHGFETLARRTKASTALVLAGRSWLEHQLIASRPTGSAAE